MKPLFDSKGDIANCSSDCFFDYELGNGSVIRINAKSFGDTLNFSAEIIHMAFEDWCHLIDKHFI